MGLPIARMSFSQHVSLRFDFHDGKLVSSTNWRCQLQLSCVVEMFNLQLLLFDCRMLRSFYGKCFTFEMEST